MQSQSATPGTAIPIKPAVGLVTEFCEIPGAISKENARLKRAVADLTPYKLILKEATEGNF